MSASHERHINYYLGFLNEDRDNWRRISAELHQIRRAWAYLPDGDYRMRDFISAMSKFHNQQGLWGEHKSWLERTLETREGEHRVEEEAALRNNIALAQFRMGNFSEACAGLEKSLALSRVQGDLVGQATALVNIGALYGDRDGARSALHYYEQALKLWDAIGDPLSAAKTVGEILSVASGEVNVAGVLFRIGQAYADLGEMELAMEHYQRALDVREVKMNRSLRVNILVGMAGVYEHRGEISLARDHYERSLAVWEELNNQPGMSVALNDLGGLALRTGDLQGALTYFKRALEISERINDRKAQATLLANIGKTYLDLGQPKQAQEYYANVLEIQREVGDRGGEAVTRNSLAAVSREIGDASSARYQLEEVLPLMVELYDRRGEALVHHNLGTVYADLGDTPLALEHYNRALSIRETLGDQADVAATLNGLATIHAGLGDVQQALSCMERAKLIQETRGDRYGLTITLHNLANVFIKIGDLQSAIVSFEKCVELLEQVKNTTLLAQTRHELANTYEEVGDIDNALLCAGKALQEQAAQGNVDVQINILEMMAGICLKHELGSRVEPILATLRPLAELTKYPGLQKVQAMLMYIALGLPQHDEPPPRAPELVTLDPAVLTKLGIQYHALQRLHRARYYLEGALAQSERIDTITRAEALHSLARIRIELGEGSEALEYFHQALSIFESVADMKMQATVLHNLGMSYLELGDTTQALDCLDRALPLRDLAGDTDGKAATLRNKGGILFRSGRLTEAEALLIEAVALAEAVGSRHSSQFRRDLDIVREHIRKG